MAVTIGAKRESDFTDPIGLLKDCHRRIERFLAVLVQVAAGTLGAQLSTEQGTALETALRYFRESAPRHTGDEEESLFPRLRKISTPEVTSTLAKVEALEKDHVAIDRGHAEVDRLGRAWLSHGTLSSEDAAQFSEVVNQLAQIYPKHIAMEEQEVFPVAARALAESERLRIGAEMAQRRGVNHVVCSSGPDA